RISNVDSPVEFVTSGGGSKAWAGKFKATSDKMEFLYDGQGFLPCSSPRPRRASPFRTSPAPSCIAGGPPGRPLPASRT
ncbi:hypothetical protein CFC21_018005, partial [Triticum aestivum]